MAVSEAAPSTPRTSGASPGTSARPPRNRSSALLTTVTWVAGLLFFFPVLWMVITAFKQENDAYTDPPRLIFEPTLDQFQALFDADALPYFLNSLMATGVSTLLVLALAVPAAYALSIRAVKKTKDVLFFFISTKMLPVVAVIVPIYVLTGRIGMLDNVWTLILLYTAMNLPIAVWMMRSFLLEVPREVLEASQMDGASLRQTITQVMLPMVAPGLAATALICVIFSWNEFFFSVNLTASTAATVPLFLVGFMTSEGLFWAQMAAAATLASLPVVLAGWAAQKQLVRGLSMGAIK